MASNRFAVLAEPAVVTFGVEQQPGGTFDTTSLSAALTGNRSSGPSCVMEHVHNVARPNNVDQKQRPASTHKQPLVWVDLEMTGLDLQKDTVIEIACILTDGRLRDPVEGPNIAIHHPDDVLNSMNEWCIEHHAASGLTERVRLSNVNMQQAEEQMLNFVKHHVPAPKMALLAGNSVHVDLAFLRQCMPRLVDHLHYRIVDVSSIAEVCRRWVPDIARKAPRKERLHTALADIRESIEELKYYKRTCFRQNG